MIDIYNMKGNGLGGVRMRLGAENVTDTSFDETIKKMTPEKFVAAWCGWHLGSESWAVSILDIYKDAGGKLDF